MGALGSSGLRRMVALTASSLAGIPSVRTWPDSDGDRIVTKRMSMNPETQCAECGRDKPQPAEKKPYQSPSLHLHGSVGELTKSGTGSLGDAGTGKRLR